MDLIQQQFGGIAGSNDQKASMRYLKFLMGQYLGPGTTYNKNCVLLFGLIYQVQRDIF